MKRLNLFLVMCLVAITSNAQSISGRVIDEQSQPMPFVNIVLVNRTDSAFVAGAVTKDDGTFSICTDKQEGLLKVSSVGYIIRYIDARQGNVGDIQMQPDTQTLGEVVVKGSRPQYQMGNEGLVTNVENTLLSQLGTASDVLKHVPGIIAKDNQYEVFGKGTPLIYINGQKMRNYKELEQLKSTDIKSIELITNPGAKYDATIGAIVKIKTVRKAGDGFSIDTWGRWQQSRKDKEAASFDMNYRSNGLDVFASLWASRGN
ncbi:MAG: carboxypeptidase-like regulatory domain-containing protein, partial [Prevotella sp.]|nr:carboxypeptidase-like regulatory domain-containing protein [Prevotella sp.]